MACNGCGVTVDRMLKRRQSERLLAKFAESSSVLATGSVVGA